MIKTNVWKSRVALARKGWHTQIMIHHPISGVKASGKNLDVRLSAQTGYWKGWSTDVSLRNSIQVPANVVAAHDLIIQAMAELSDACQKAETEYVDSIPCQSYEKCNPNAITLADHTYENEYQIGRERTYFPTESIPSAIEDAHPEYGNTHVDALLKAALDNYTVYDAVDSFHGQPRMSKDCKDRTWGYRIRLARRLACDGTQVSHKPLKCSVEALDEFSAAALTTGAKSGLDRLFLSSLQGLPAGFKSPA